MEGCDVPEGLLAAEHEQLVRAERALLDDLRLLLAGFEATADDLATLGRAARDLDDLFLLVVVGEFNAGKSALINALLGGQVLPEGATPTTDTVNVLRYGEQAAERVIGEALVERVSPSPFLRDLAIVDTPGTNAVIRRHEEITRDFVPRSDLVLFVTSADRPFSESERQFLATIREWGKKVVIILNKRDLLAADDLPRVMGFIEGNANALLGFQPTVLSVSARQALAALQQADAAQRSGGLVASGLSALEQYLRTALDERGRLKLKLASPLGVAGLLLGRYGEVAERRMRLLDEDMRTNTLIEDQMGEYERDMRRDFTSRLSQIDATIYELDQRADAFFEATLRLGRLPDLFNADKIRGEFERAVVADTPQRIDNQMQELVDWMADRELRLWQQIVDILNRRRQAGVDEGMLGQVGREFSSSRRELIGSVARAARDVVERYDEHAQAAELAASMREAVTQTGLVAAGGVALGAAIALIAGTAAMDVTGILAASVIAGLGLFIIPRRRQKAMREFHRRSAELRSQLRAGVEEQFAGALARSLERMRDTIAPYVRFVRAELSKLQTVQEKLEALDSEVGRLQTAVERL
jgi:small GTP-binding protein